MNTSIDIGTIESDYEESYGILISFIDGYNSMKRKFSSEIADIDNTIAEINVKLQSYSQYINDDSSVFSPFSETDEIKEKCNQFNKELEELNIKKGSLLSRIERIDSQTEQLSFVSDYIMRTKNYLSSLSDNNNVNDKIEDVSDIVLNDDSDIITDNDNSEINPQNQILDESVNQNSVDYSVISDSLSFIEKILPADPMRAKTEIREIINKVSRETSSI